jgi:hypothetical protein
MKIDNGTGGSRETSTGGPGSEPGRSVVDEWGRVSINFCAELKRRNVYKVAIERSKCPGLKSGVFD